MKKSEILKQVLTKIGTYSNFICNILKYHVTYAAPGSGNAPSVGSATKAYELVKWINESIKHAPGVETAGVQAWLVAGGYYDPNVDYTGKEVLEYRRLWLADMIAYWEAQGD
jgi:hypothetical protein